MTKNEALKKCIDGAEIRHKGYRENNLIYFDGEKFVLTDGFISMDADGPAFAHKDGWQIVPEYVDFAEALKFYKQGKLIESCTAERYKKGGNRFADLCVDEDEVDGKWLILEDE